jgi:hypothetical protein
VAVTTSDLRSLVGAGSETTDAELTGHIETAEELVGAYVEDNVVPVGILDRCYLVVAAEMFNQDQAPNGVLNQQYDTEDGTIATPIRIGADPLRPAYPLLARWVLPVSIG